MATFAALFLDKLKKRWSVQSAWDVVAILCVFALTGTSIMLLRKVLVVNFEWAKASWFTYTYYWVIFPIYNIVLLGFGFIFGKFKFFWDFEVKTLNRIKGLFVKNKKN